MDTISQAIDLFLSTHPGAQLGIAFFGLIFVIAWLGGVKLPEDNICPHHRRKAKSKQLIERII
jgi:hypothetical protein